jgi:hypothetical protein
MHYVPWQFRIQATAVLEILLAALSSWGVYTRSWLCGYTLNPQEGSAGKDKSEMCDVLRGCCLAPLFKGFCVVVIAFWADMLSAAFLILLFVPFVAADDWDDFTNNLATDLVGLKVEIGWLGHFC